MILAATAASTFQSKNTRVSFALLKAWLIIDKYATHVFFQVAVVREPDKNHLVVKGAYKS